MTCSDLDDLIEPIAAGDLVPALDIRAHLDTCPGCAAALALATAVDRTLAATPAPDPPAHFVEATMTRVRRARWRSEQYLDLAFNLVAGLAVLVALAGLWLLLSVTGVTTVGSEVGRLFADSTVALLARMRPALPLYAAGVALVGTALALWWLAERGLEI
jgi:anti-sigma factor RsiW